MVLEQLCREFALSRKMELEYSEGELRAGFPLFLRHYYKEGGDYLFVHNREVQVVVERFPYDRQMSVAIARGDLSYYLGLLAGKRDKFCGLVYRQFQKSEREGEVSGVDNYFRQEQFRRFTQRDIRRVMDCLF